MAKSTNTLATRIAPQDSGRRTAAKPPTGIQAFMVNMQYHSNVQESTVIVAEQAEHEFGTEHGWEIEQLNRVLPGIGEGYKTSEANVKALKKTLDNTAPYIKAAADDDSAQQQTVFGQWAFKDKILMVITAIALISAMVMGGANVFANLMASGVGIFLIKPYLAVAISLLLPIAATAIKNLSHYIHNPLYRRWYGLGIYGLTLVLLLIWAVLFAQSFSGVAETFDPAALLDDSGNDDSGAALV